MAMEKKEQNLSLNTRNAKWGSAAIVSKSASIIADLQTYENQPLIKSASAIADLNDGVIDVFQAIKIPETRDFPVEDFFRVPFSHHIRIIEKVEDFKARCYYINRTAQEFLSEKALDKIIKTDAYEHKDRMPNNFSATLSDSKMARKAVMMFKDEYLLDFINVEEIGERDKETSEEMPEKLRKALPDVEELKKLL